MNYFSSVQLWHVQHIWNVFLSMFIMTVIVAAAGGGAGFSQMALAALHTGLLGTEQFN